MEQNLQKNTSIMFQRKQRRIRYTMLFCVQQKSVEKAEAIVQKMRDIGDGGKGNFKDKKMMKVLMSAYVAASDISMMELVLKWVEKDPNFVVDWKLYSIAANGYLKVLE